MKVGAIIFSRISSNRLPGKALLDISGRTLLGRVLDRTKAIEGINEVIISTSSEKEDDLIEQFAKKEKVETYRGSLENVVERALETCSKYNLDKFARICGDRPFFDPKLVSKLIKIHNELDLDIATTTFPSSYPSGLNGEVINTRALSKVFKKINNKDDLEHLTSYFYKNSSNFSIRNISAPKNLKLNDLSLSIDTKEDLDRAIWISEKLSESNDYDNLEQLVKLALEWNLSKS